MKHEHFNWKEHGFVGHLAEPDGGSDKAVIVIMGGEQSLLPGIKFAERFADYGITGLAVSLFGAEGLPECVDQIPLDMFIPAVDYLKRIKKIRLFLSILAVSRHPGIISIRMQIIGLSGCGLLIIMHTRIKQPKKRCGCIWKRPMQEFC